MNPYQILNISEDADAEEIKAAYRQLAKKYHPDANLQDLSSAEKMHEINEAFHMLRTRKNIPLNTEDDLFDFSNYTYENGEVPEEYSKSWMNCFRNVHLQRIILFILAGTFLFASIALSFFQSVSL